VIWNNGLYFQTKEKDFVAHLGGLFMLDGGWFTTSPSTLQAVPGQPDPFGDGVFVRRGRLWVEGTMSKTVDFVFGLEFFNGYLDTGAAVPANGVIDATGPVDCNLTLTHVPYLGNVRVGYQKQWFSLEALNSVRFLEFMERSYLFDATQLTSNNNGRSPGISAFRTWADDRVFSGVGVYKNVGTPFGFGLGDGEYVATGRLGGLPVWRPEADCFWFVGGAMSHLDTIDGQVRVRARNAVRNAPGPLLDVIVDTAQITAGSQTLFNVQTAAVNGPLTFQAEYLANLVRGASVGTGPNLGTVPFQGFYVEGMWLLTGESRKWRPTTMTFDRIVPRRNFGFMEGGCAHGPGAWEVAVRYQYLDLTRGGIVGGRLSGVTLGLNWYWNPNAKVQFNYDYVNIDESTAANNGRVNSFGTRVAFDF
jgi:phosphate-selective porin OprO/OprP